MTINGKLKQKHFCAEKPVPEKMFKTLKTSKPPYCLLIPPFIKHINMPPQFNICELFSAIKSSVICVFSSSTTVLQLTCTDITNEQLGCKNNFFFDEPLCKTLFPGGYDRTSRHCYEVPVTGFSHRTLSL